jgi:hypothetical protein
MRKRREHGMLVLAPLAESVERQLAAAPLCICRWMTCRDEPHRKIVSVPASIGAVRLTPVLI